MIPNIHPTTKIAYGYVAAQDLDQEIVDILLGYQPGAAIRSSSVDRAWEHFKQTLQGLKEEGDDFDLDHEKQMFFDEYEDPEPIIEGVYDGVSYISSWLGGALNFLITESPCIAATAGQPSPCVPNAGILHKPHERSRVISNMCYMCYDVPPSWWDTTDAPACHHTWGDQIKEE